MAKKTTTAKQQTKREPQPVPVEIPDWVNYTPGYEYFLRVVSDDLNGAPWNGDEPPQNVEITREEFIALKQALARLRGYNLESEENIHGK